MAKITAVIDTESKVLEISIDDKVIKNANSVSAYAYKDSEGKPSGVDCSVQLSEKMENGIVKITNFYAMGSEGYKNEIAKASVKNDDLVGFVGIECASDEIFKMKVRQDIASYFADKR